MNKALVNNEIFLTVPGGFELIEHKELKEIYKDAAEKSWGIKNDEMNIKVSLLWQEGNVILINLADINTVAIKNEMIARKAYISKGYNYKLDSFYSLKIHEKKGRGYRFTFTKSGTDKALKTVLFKHRSKIYGLSVLGPISTNDKINEIFDNITESIELK